MKRQFNYNPEPKIPMGISITPSLRLRISEAAMELGRSRSVIICELIEEWLNQRAELEQYEQEPQGEEG